eukprot:3289085-Rhodomonas_salina.1
MADAAQPSGCGGGGRARNFTTGGRADHDEQAQGLRKGGLLLHTEPSKDDLLMWVWVDSKPVVCISNIQVHPAAVPVVTAECLMKGLAVLWSCPCQGLLPMKEYNGWMGANDNFDSLMSFHTCKLHSLKWWHTIFYFLIDASSINSLHLWRIANPPQDHEGQLLQCIWIAGLIEEILEKYGAKGGKPVPDSSTDASAEVLLQPFLQYGYMGNHGGSHSG